MTMLTTAIPVWLNVTCNECSHHEDIQLGSQTQISDDPKTSDFRCSECGSNEAGKINISGSSNANMKTLEDVRQG